MGVGKITKGIVREAAEKIVVKKKRGNKTYLLKDEKTYIMTTSEIDGSHGIPRDIHKFTDKLQRVIHDIGGQSIGNGINPSSAQRYACRLIQRVNRTEEGEEGQKRRMRIGLIKVSGLGRKRGKQSDPRLSCFLFHKIFRVYS